MAEFNTVDVKNAARLIKDYCEAKSSCEGCAFYKGPRALANCELEDDVPCYWSIDDKEVTHD